MCTCCMMLKALDSGMPTTCTKDLETYSRVLPLSLKRRTLNYSYDDNSSSKKRRTAVLVRQNARK